MKKTFVFYISAIVLFLGFTDLKGQKPFSKTYDSKCHASDTLRLLTIKYTQETGCIVISSYIDPEIKDSVIVPSLDSAIASVILKAKLKSNDSFAGIFRFTVSQSSGSVPTPDIIDSTGSIEQKARQGGSASANPGPKTPASLTTEEFNISPWIDTLVGQFIRDYKIALIKQEHEQEINDTKEQLSSALSGMDDAKESAFTVTLTGKACQVYPVYKNKHEYDKHQEILKLSYCLSLKQKQLGELTKTTEIENLAKKMNTDSVQADTLFKKSNSLTTQLNQLKKDSKLNADSVGILKKSLAADSVKLAGLPVKSEKRTTLQKKMSKDLSHCNDLKTKMIADSLSVVKLNDTINSNHLSVLKLKSQRNTDSTKIHDLRNKVNNNKTDIDTLNHQITRATNKINCLQTSLDKSHAYRNINDRHPAVELSDTLHFVVSTVSLQFSHWVLGRVDVNGKIGDKSYHFRNIRVVPVASHFSIERAHEEMLVSDDFNYMIRLGDVLQINPNDTLNLNIYHPESQTVWLTANSNDETETISKPSVGSYFNIAVFSDLNGYLGDNQPNGKLQTEAYAIIPIWTRPFRISRPKPIPERAFSRKKHTMYPPHYPPSYTMFKSIMPEFCVSKFGTENRFLPVQFTSELPNRNHNDTLVIKHINQVSLLQYSNLWVGGAVNILSMEGQNSSSAIYVNFRCRIMRTELSDSTHTAGKTNNVIFVNYEPEIVCRMKIHKNFRLEFAFSINYLKMFNNEYDVSYGRMYGDKRDTTFVRSKGFFKTRDSDLKAELIFIPQFTLRYNPPGKPLNGAFFRMQFPNNPSTNNGFLILQIGFQRPISSFASKPPKDEGSAKDL